VRMLKKDAIRLIGSGSPTKAARAMGYKSAMAVHMWPDVLPQSVADRVLAVWIRQNAPAIIPKEFTESENSDKVANVSLRGATTVSP